MRHCIFNDTAALLSRFVKLSPCPYLRHVITNLGDLRHVITNLGYLRHVITSLGYLRHVINNLGCCGWHEDWLIGLHNACHGMSLSGHVSLRNVQHGLKTDMMSSLATCTVNTHCM